MSDMLSKNQNWVIALGRFSRQPINALWTVLGMLAFFFVWALLADKGGAVARLLEIDNKAEMLRLIGWGMGGVLAAIGVIALNRRATAMEKGLIDEQFKAAVQGLAGEQPSVRIAAFYQFYYLAKDNPDMDFRSSIFDILCAHLRQMTSESDYQSSAGQEKPTEECQSLLDVLFRKSRNIFAGMKADMKNAYLVRANLSNTELQQADFRGANVSGANFEKANVLAANFWGVNLSGANFRDANALAANFWNTNLSAANFVNANLSAAGFLGADVSEVNFGDANLSAANFGDANLSAAFFGGANLSATDFWKANLSVAFFEDANLSAANFKEADVSSANFEKADVSDANFENATLYGVDFSSAKGINSAKFSNIKIDADTKFPEWFREGEHYTVAKEEE